MLTIRRVLEHRVERIGPDELESALAGRGFVWLDFAAPTPNEEAVLDHPALGIDPLASEDAREDVHLPKVDAYVDHLLVVVHPIEVETSTVEVSTLELDIVVADRFIVTFHRRPVSAVEAVGQAVDLRAPGLERPVQVLHRILDVMNDVFVPFLDLLGQRLDLVEDDVLGSPSATTRAEIFSLRRDLITLRRISVPQAEVVRRLSTLELPVIGAADRPLFRDVYDHLYRMSEMSEVYRQLVESAYDMYRSIREDETNRRVTVLTVVSTIVLPIMVVSGIYGMNFENMPELRMTWTYPLFWVFVVTVIVGGLALFRASGWLGREEDPEVARRRRLAERLEVPSLGQVLNVPAYGARFAVRGGRRVFGLGRLFRGRGARRVG